MNVKKLLKKIFVSHINKKNRIRFKYFFKKKYFLNTNRFDSFSEKIQKRKIEYSIREKPLYHKLSDKIEVKSYVEKLIGDQYIIKTIDSFSREELIERFDATIYDNVIIKSNHSSGNVYIIKEPISEQQSNNILKNLLSELEFDYGLYSEEEWYSNINKKIIVEELLLDDLGNPPNDYKFHVFGKNKKIYVQVDFDRFTDHNRTIYDEYGNIEKWSIGYKNYFREFPEKKYLADMVYLANILSEGFDYVRIDFYLHNGKIYFGEYTFAHGSGFEKITPQKYDNIIGSNW